MKVVNASPTDPDRMTSLPLNPRTSPIAFPALFLKTAPTSDIFYT